MASSKFRDDKIKNLVLKLHTLLPQLNHKFDHSKVPIAEILKETCDCIKKLEREIDDLSERLWEQLESMGVDLEMVKRGLN
ncbi:Transcription factor PRE4, partial [Cucurbita argyrosperma subsp. sororia]